MMKSSICEFAIVLDDPDRVYSPGEYVHGKIVLKTKKAVRISKLFLECRGEAYVSWPENAGTYTRYRFGKEEYYNIKSCIYDQETSNQDVSTSEQNSNYAFSFRFTIPYQDLPPSYESLHGYIRYSIRAQIQNKKGKTKLKTNEALFAIGNYEEYDEDELEEIRDNEQILRNGKDQTTVLGRPCYPAGIVTLSAYTNKLLYQGGESIKTTMHVDCEQGRELYHLGVSLVRLTKYSDGKGHTTYSTDRVVAIEKEKELAQDSLDTLLVIPRKICPTVQLGCKCINVHYHIEVRLLSNGKSRNGKSRNGKSRKEPSIKIPVIIISSSTSSPASTPKSLTSSETVTNHSVSNKGSLFYVTGRPTQHNGPYVKRSINDGSSYGDIYSNHSVSYV